MKKKLVILLCMLGILCSFIGCGKETQSLGVSNENLSEDTLTKLSAFSIEPTEINYNFDNLIYHIGSRSYNLMDTKSNDIFQLGSSMEKNAHLCEFNGDGNDYEEVEVTYSLKDKSILTVKDVILKDNPDFRIFAYASLDMSQIKNNINTSFMGLSYHSTLEDIQNTFGKEFLCYPNSDTTIYWYSISICEIPMEAKVIYNHRENHIESIAIESFFNKNIRYINDDLQRLVENNLK